MNPKWHNSWLNKKNGQLKFTLSTRKEWFLVTLYFLIHFLNFSHKILPLNLLIALYITVHEYDILFITVCNFQNIYIFLAGFPTNAQVGTFKIPDMSVPPYTAHKVIKNCIPKALLTKYMLITIVQVYLCWICNSTFCTTFF